MRQSAIVAVVICFLLSACSAKPPPTPEPTATPRPPTATLTGTPVPTATRSPTRTIVPTPTVITYVVQAGDVLGIIAQTYRTTVEAIAAANGITDLDLIRVGQELVIPPPGVPTAAP